MAHAQLPVIERGFGRTMRRDAWWVQPLIVFIILASFVAYATWAAFQGEHYTWGPYLSPFYSPELFGNSPHAVFGGRPAWWPSWLVFSPALLILPFPGLFRLTCYYYRGAYYKAFWADPPSCAVGEPRKRYLGEQSFPLIVQNLHRYILYIALVFLVVLLHDVYKALWFTDPATGATEFGIGVGTLVLALNVTLLGGYTLGCHSLRHLAGGYLDRLSGSPVRRTAYRCSSCLNRAHQRWAWTSLFAVAFADVYVRLCSMGVWTDWRIL
ncbi:MAG: succinate dehydrogenase [Gemmatimonadaceae bacterium]